jgi:hypothetical protein
VIRQFRTLSAAVRALLVGGAAGALLALLERLAHPQGTTASWGYFILMLGGAFLGVGACWIVQYMTDRLLHRLIAGSVIGLVLWLAIEDNSGLAGSGWHYAVEVIATLVGYAGVGYAVFCHEPPGPEPQGRQDPRRPALQSRKGSGRQPVRRIRRTG